MSHVYIASWSANHWQRQCCFCSEAMKRDVWGYHFLTLSCLTWMVHEPSGEMVEVLQLCLCALELGCLRPPGPPPTSTQPTGTEARAVCQGNVWASWGSGTHPGKDGVSGAGWDASASYWLLCSCWIGGAWVWGVNTAAIATACRAGPSVPVEGRKQPTLLDKRSQTRSVPCRISW